MRSTLSDPRRERRFVTVRVLGGRRHAVRERAVRPSARCVCRRDRSDSWRLRAGRRRNVVPRRGRRGAARSAAEAAARHRHRRGAADRVERRSALRRPRCRGHEPRSAGGGRGGTVPARSLRAVARRPSRDSAAAATARRHPAADRGVRRGSWRADRSRRLRTHDRRRAGAAAGAVGGECPRAEGRRSSARVRRAVRACSANARFSPRWRASADPVERGRRS